MKRSGYLVLLSLLLAGLDVLAIKDKDNQGRWEKPVEKGPDREVPGFLVNLGPTGARAVLTEKTFLVRYVFPGSPAQGRLRVGDVVTGASGKPFSAHTFGGSPHGYEGPIMDLGNAIEDAEGGDGSLKLNVRRGTETLEVVVPLEAIGRFAPTFPVKCRKSRLLRTRALNYLAAHPEALRSPPHARSMVILALLTSGNPEHEKIGKQAALAWNSMPGRDAWTWPLAYQLITLAEYHLLTGDGAVLETIRGLSQRLRENQYDGRGNPILKWKPGEVQGDYARIDASQQLYRGGFGHAPYVPGIGGYGPMQYTTILAVIAWQLAERCGISTDPTGMKYAFEFIHRGTNEAGYVAYGGEFTLNNGYVDPVRWKQSTRGDNYVGRAGASLIAHRLSPEFPESAEYAGKNKQYMLHAYKSLPDGHACSVLGFAWGLLGAGAAQDESVVRAMFDYHKAWFNMMRCHDGSYVVQPGRDYADGGYYISSRYNSTASMALALGLGYPKLQIQGIEVGIPGVNPKALEGTLLSAYRAVVAKSYGKAAKLAEAGGPQGRPIRAYLEAQGKRVIDSLRELETSGQWVRLQERIAELRPAYGGLAGFDAAVAAWETRLKGSPILAAERFRLDGRYGKALTALGATEGPEAQAVRARILKAAAEVLARWEALRQEGRWQTLKKDLDSEMDRFRAIQSVERRGGELKELLASEAGRALIEADRKVSEGAVGQAMVALKDARTEPANALRSRAEQAGMEAVASLETLEKEGRWATLKGRLAKERSKLAGFGPFDERAGRWDGYLKSVEGRSAVSAEQKYEKGRLGAAVKGAAPPLRKRIEEQVRAELETLKALEAKGAYYELKTALVKLGRDLKGVEAFDQQEAAWHASFREEPARTALRQGALFVRLREAVRRKVTSTLRRQLKAFVDQAGDTYYGREGRALLREVGN